MFMMMDVSIYLLSIMMAGLGYFVPLFIPLSVVVGSWPFLRTAIFGPARKRRNLLGRETKPGEKVVKMTAEGKMVRLDSNDSDEEADDDEDEMDEGGDPMDIWFITPSLGSQVALSNVETPLMLLPAPWEAPSLLADIVGERGGLSNGASNIIWLGLGEADDGYAIRKEFCEAQKVKIVRVGRVNEIEPSAITSFASTTADSPLAENGNSGGGGGGIVNSIFGSSSSTPPRGGAASSSSSSSSKKKRDGSSSSSSSSSSSLFGGKGTSTNSATTEASTLSAETASDDQLRVGDVVKLIDGKTSKHLAALDGIWLSMSSESITPSSYFVITVADDNGKIKYGTPVTAGMPFRLRSARWPKYEIGCQTSASPEHGGMHLLLYEFPIRPTKSSVRSKGGLVNPLFLSTISNEARISIEPKKKQAHSKKSGWNPVRSLLRGVGLSRSNHAFDASVVGWVEVLHRISRTPYLVFVIVVSGNDDNGPKRWTCLRTAQETSYALTLAEEAAERSSSSSGGGGGGGLWGSSSSSSSSSSSNSKNNNNNSGDGGFSSGSSGSKSRRLEKPLQHETPADQTLRAVGHRLEDVVTVAQENKASKQVLQNFLCQPLLWDDWFLSGGKSSLGVTLIPDPELGRPISTFTVVRAVWETHWREEVLVLFKREICFYAPLSNVVSWSLMLREIIGVSHVALDESPLPGYYTLRLETMGRIHYICCNSYAGRENLASSILDLISILPFDPNALSAKSFNSLLGGASADSFTLQCGQWLPTTRLLLNARKFSFDFQSRSGGGPASISNGSSSSSSVVGGKNSGSSSGGGSSNGETYWALSARLLKCAFDLEIPHQQAKAAKAALAVSGGGVEQDGSGGGGGGGGKKSSMFSSSSSSSNGESGETMNRDKLLSFMDDTSCLKSVNLRAMDLSSPEALCFFSNVYHCLLIHARIVLRLPTKADWSVFFGCICYEVGGDVFSLAELEQCVLRGRLSRPRLFSRHDPPTLPLTDDHFSYALGKADLRINFLVNSGSVSNPENIYLLTPENLEAQLNKASHVTLTHSMNVDFSYNAVTLPKVCEIYRADLGEDNISILKCCLKFLERSGYGADLETLLKNEKGRAPPSVKFLLQTYESHSRLQLCL